MHLPNLDQCKKSCDDDGKCIGFAAFDDSCHLSKDLDVLIKALATVEPDVNIT